MRSKIAVGFVTVLAIAIPAKAHAGIVVAKHSGTVVVVRANGIGIAVRGTARIGDRVTLSGGHIRVSGRAHGALIRGIVVRQLPHSLLVTTGGNALRIRLQPRALADHGGHSEAGTVGEFRVRIDDDDLVEDQPVVPVGQAATVRIEGVVLSTSPFVVSVEGIPLTIAVPAGTTVPAAGQRIEATIMVGTTPNTFTLVSVDVEAREVRARGTVASSTATQIVVNTGGAMVTFNAPAGTTLPILATGTFVEARGIMRNGVTTLTRLRTDHDH